MSLDQLFPSEPHRHPGVGFSIDRTPAKHDIYRAHLGQEIGSAAVVINAVRRTFGKQAWKDLFYDGHLIVDLTAGDGVSDGIHSAWHLGCSPGIAAHMASRNKRARVRLYEKNKEAFQRLIENLARELPRLGYGQRDETEWQHTATESTVRAACGDARELEKFTDLRPHEWVYVYNDPNNMNGWVLDVELFASLLADGRRFGSSMSTMGCNSGGLKRLDLQPHRSIWFDHINHAKRIIAKHPRLDLILFEALNDASQWAYLLLTPVAWTTKNIDLMTRQFSRHSLAVAACSWRTAPTEFDETCRRLFLRKSERGE